MDPTSNNVPTMAVASMVLRYVSQVSSNLQNDDASSSANIIPTVRCANQTIVGLNRDQTETNIAGEELSFD